MITIDIVPLVVDAPHPFWPYLRQVFYSLDVVDQLSHGKYPNLFCSTQKHVHAQGEDDFQNH